MNHRLRQATVFAAVLAAVVALVAVTTGPGPQPSGTCSGSVPYGLAYATTDPVFGNLVCVQNTPPPAPHRSSS